MAVLTFNFYRYYWDYKAHMELYHQFELSREGRRDGVVWYTMARIFSVLDFPYFYYFASNLEYLGRRMNHNKVAKPGLVLGLLIPAYTLLILGTLPGSVVAMEGLDVNADGEVVVVSEAQLIAGVIMAVGGLVSWIVLKAAAYAHLQGAVNRIWASYDWRMRQIRSSADDSAPAGGPDGQLS